MAEMVAYLIQAYFASPTAQDSRPLHDPCVMLFALSPELFECEDLELSVSVATDERAGELAVMAQGRNSVQVVMGVDAPAVLELLAERLTAAQAMVRR